MLSQIGSYGLPPLFDLFHLRLQVFHRAAVICGVLLQFLECFGVPFEGLPEGLFPAFHAPQQLLGGGDASLRRRGLGGLLPASRRAGRGGGGGVAALRLTGLLSGRRRSFRTALGGAGCSGWSSGWWWWTPWCRLKGLGWKGWLARHRGMV